MNMYFTYNCKKKFKNKTLYWLYIPLWLCASLYKQVSWNCPLHPWSPLSHCHSHLLTHHCNKIGIAVTTKDFRVVQPNGYFPVLLLDILAAVDTYTHHLLKTLLSFGFQDNTLIFYPLYTSLFPPSHSKWWSSKILISLYVIFDDYSVWW